MESTDSGVRVVEQAAYASLPTLARAEALVSSGARDADLSVGGDIAAAVDAYSRLR